MNNKIENQNNKIWHQFNNKILTKIYNKLFNKTSREIRAKTYKNFHSNYVTIKARNNIANNIKINHINHINHE